MIIVVDTSITLEAMSAVFSLQNLTVRTQPVTMVMVSSVTHNCQKIVFFIGFQVARVNETYPHETNYHCKSQSKVNSDP